MNSKDKTCREKKKWRERKREMRGQWGWGLAVDGLGGFIRLEKCAVWVRERICVVEEGAEFLGVGGNEGVSVNGPILECGKYMSDEVSEGTVFDYVEGRLCGGAAWAFKAVGAVFVSEAEPSAIVSCGDMSGEQVGQPVNGGGGAGAEGEGGDDGWYCR